MARLGVHSKLERQTLAALSYVLRRVIGRRLRILRRRPFIVYVFSFVVVLSALQRWFGPHWISK